MNKTSSEMCVLGRMGSLVCVGGNTVMCFTLQGSTFEDFEFNS
jgi:hypothetical protein